MKFYRRLNTIKAISFDLDDTFYDNHPYIVAAEKALFAHLCHHWPEFESAGRTLWKQSRKACIRESPLLAHDMIALRRCVLRRVFLHMGLSGNPLEKAVQSSYLVFYEARSNFQVLPAYVALLQGLARQLPVIAITNGNVDIERVGFVDCFSHVFHASTTLRSKPYPDMFDQAAEAVGVDAKNILHVGDNLEKDVFGALNAGYMAAWYAENRPMQLPTEPAQQLPHLQLDTLQELQSLLS